MGGVESLFSTIKSCPHDEVKEKAMTSLVNMTVLDDMSRRKVVEIGGLEELTSHIRAKNNMSEGAIKTMLNLSLQG